MAGGPVDAVRPAAPGRGGGEEREGREEENLRGGEGVRGELQPAWCESLPPPIAAAVT